MNDNIYRIDPTTGALITDAPNQRLDYYETVDTVARDLLRRAQRLARICGHNEIDISFAALSEALDRVIGQAHPAMRGAMLDDVDALLSPLRMVERDSKSASISTAIN